MISLFKSFAILLIGYIVYGRVVEKIFAPDDRQTPAIAINDGVDCVPMKRWTAFLIQLLNTAGTDPIFGALLTAFPTAFMTAVSVTYILMAKEGFRLDQTVSYIAGANVAALLLIVYLVFLIRKAQAAKQ